MADDAQYHATLLDRFGAQQARDFDRLNDAIIWLSGEFAAGDGNALYGEIRFDGAIVWRKAPPGYKPDRGLGQGADVLNAATRTLRA